MLTTHIHINNTSFFSKNYVGTRKFFFFSLAEQIFKREREYKVERVERTSQYEKHGRYISVRELTHK